MTQSRWAAAGILASANVRTLKPIWVASDARDDISRAHHSGDLQRAPAGSGQLHELGLQRRMRRSGNSSEQISRGHRAKSSAKRQSRSISDSHDGGRPPRACPAVRPSGSNQMKHPSGSRRLGLSSKNRAPGPSERLSTTTRRSPCSATPASPSPRSTAFACASCSIKPSPNSLKLG